MVHYNEHARRRRLNINDLACALRCFAEIEYLQHDEQYMNCEDDDEYDSDMDEDMDTQSDESSVVYHLDETKSDEIVYDVSGNFDVYYGVFKMVQISQGISVEELIIEIDEKLRVYKTDILYQK